MNNPKEQLIDVLSNLEVKLPNTNIYYNRRTGMQCLPKDQDPTDDLVFIGRATDLMYLYEAKKQTIGKSEALRLAREMASRHVEIALGI